MPTHNSKVRSEWTDRKPERFAAGQEDSSRSGVSLYYYLDIIKRHIWWGVVCFLVLFTSAILYTFVWVKPVYRATVVSEVEDSWSVLSPTGMLTSPKVTTYRHLIKNQDVLLEAMQQLGLVTESISFQERERRVKEFTNELIISNIEKTSIIEIHYDHRDPAQAARRVNTIVKVFLGKTLEDKKQKTDRGCKFIQGQLNEIGKQLNILEQKLQEMKVSGQTTEKTEILANKLAQIELSFVTQSSKLGVKHPQVVALQEEMAELKKQMMQLSPNDLVYLKILREKKLNENLFNLLNTRLKEEQIELEDKTIPFRVVSWALISDIPFKPNKKMLLILGVLLSLLISFTIILLRESLDLSLDTPEKLEEYLKIPCLVTVPRFKRFSQTINPSLKAQSQLAGTIVPDTGIPTPLPYSRDECELMERLRQLEIKINPEGDGATRVALISSMKGTGKTTLVSYYGRTAAEDGKKVLLVDLDLRNPHLHTKFNLHKEPGMVDILSKGMALNGVIKNIPQPGRANSLLNIITSGRPTKYPLRLIGSPYLDEFLETIRKSYDLIVFDTAPIPVAAETMILCRKIEGHIIVHKAGRLDRYIMGQFKSQFRAEEWDKCWGVVLNNCRYQEAGYYYGYYSEYYQSDESGAR